MNKFSEKSLKQLETCHKDLQLIANELIKELDVVILCGHRNEQDQTSAFINGFSKLQWPRSKHNRLPSEAIDIAPYPINFNNTEAFLDMCDRIERIAYDLNIKVRMGRDFSFRDLVHTELVLKN